MEMFDKCNFSDNPFIPDYMKNVYFNRVDDSLSQKGKKINKEEIILFEEGNSIINFLNLIVSKIIKMKGE